jgi:hypothetical protein
MQVDDTALVFIVEFFELLQTARARLSSAYSENARMILQLRDQPTKALSQPFHLAIPAGPRKLLQCSGEVISGFLYVHVRSTLTLPTETQILDEAFVCSLSEAGIIIQYHSIHISPILSAKPILPPPKPLPKPAPAPAKPPPAKPAPIEVVGLATLDPNKSVMVKNLPFGKPSVEYLPELVKNFGDVVKYAQTKGKLAVEFIDRDTRNRAARATWSEWNGRLAKVVKFDPKEPW